MTLCLDIGNSQIYGGLFKGDQLMLQFRRASRSPTSSDEIGIFLKSVLRENDLDPEKVTEISICTVVPEILHSLRNACRKYFNITPFIIQAGVKTGLNIKYRNSLELGSDRIANAIAATQKFPDENLIIIDMGTATTFCAISKKREFLGGAIIPGIRIQMSSLVTNTSKLPTVELIPMKSALGRSTIEGIQGGLYFGTIGAIREITARLKSEAFRNETVRVIGTGGFASLFVDQGLFETEIPDLVLQGLRMALKLNEKSKLPAQQRGEYATAHVEM